MKHRFKGVVFSLIALFLFLQVSFPVFAEDIVDNDVEKETTTIEMPAKKKVTYNGKTQNVVVKDVYGSTGDISYTYYIDKACTKLVTPANSGSLTDGSAPVKPGLYYVVASVTEDEEYNGATSSPCQLMIIPRKIGKVSATNLQNGTKLSWPKCNEADGYIIYYKNIYGEYEQGAVIKSNTKLSYTYTGTNNGVKYKFNVVAYCNLPESNQVIISDFQGTDKEIINNKLTITNQSGSVKLKWKKTNDEKVKGYYIYRKTSKDSSFKKVKTITSRKTTTWTDKSSKAIVNGRKSQYYIKVYYGKSNSVVSKSANYTNYYLSRPTASKSGKYLKWKRNTQASGYEVHVDSMAIDSDKRYTSNKTVKSKVYTDSFVTSAKVRAYKKVNGIKYYSAWKEVSCFSDINFNKYR